MITTIALIGFMGSGKTTVGKRIQEMYPMYQFLDSDEEIVKRAGMSIPEIFESQGEAAFRKMECDYLKELSENPADSRIILSTGGGMPMNPDSGKILKEKAFTVYLYADVDELYERLKNDKGRPLLQVEDRRAVISDMYEKRNPVYSQVATYKVNTAGRLVDEVCDEIIGTYNMFIQS